MPISAPPALVTMITAAFTPVVLVTSAAILLGAVTNRYGALAAQVRQLTAERRHADTAPARRESLTRQIAIFRKRIGIAWFSTILLCLAIVLFLSSVMVLFFQARQGGFTTVSLGPIAGGLMCMTLSVIVDVIEIAYGHKTLEIETSEED